MISIGKKVVASGIYSVAADPAGGAVGTVKVGINLPGSITPGSYVTLTGAWVGALSTLTSGGSATISVGLVANVNGTVTTRATAIKAVTAYTAFNAAVDAQGNFQPILGAVTQAAPVKLFPMVAGGGPITGWDVIVVIGTAALTGGSIQIQLEMNVTPQ